MTPREIIGELGEALGICDQVQLLRRINRAVELLSAKDLFDPLIGYLNFQVDGAGNFIALPREVRAVLAVNINNQPAFARGRFYEFDLNTPGTVAGDSVQWEWNDRCNVVVQDERKLPGVLTYRCSLADDNGLNCTVEGRDSGGRLITETLVAHNTSPGASAHTFHEVTRVYRDTTGGECFLFAAGELIAQYYGDETAPIYRSIRLSRSVASVRIMFRREPLKITTLDSYIPLNSPMAVIQAAKAVGHLTEGEDDKADLCIARAEKFIKEDQQSREDGDKLAERQAVGVLGTGLGHSEGITVMDVYDPACEIFGQVGRPNIFKKITQACQVLCNKAHWDGMIGMVDIEPRSNDAEINVNGSAGHGYYTLPRFVGTPLKLNVCGEPQAPRNQWFDFHLNGPGERNLASFGRWDDLGDTALCDFIAREPGTGRVIPTDVMAICDNALDEGKSVRIYGREYLNGRIVEVWRGGERGWVCPCKVTFGTQPITGSPKWVDIDKIERAETRGFVRLMAYTATLVPGANEVDRTTITAGYALTGTWSGEHFGVRVYVRVIDGNTVVFGDSVLSITVGSTALTQSTDSTVANPVVFTLDGMTFTGTWRRTAVVVSTPFANGVVAFQIARTVTSAVAGSWRLVGTRQLGFWYPDEIEPSYRLIRVSTSHPKRLRVMYRKHFKRICSLYDPIPLRSSLAVEDMLRALKAHELGLVQNAEPLEMKAVQYLSEDRIKAGENEMPTMEFDNSTAPGGFENIS